MATSKEGVIKEARPLAQTTIGTISKSISINDLGLNLGGINPGITIDIPFEDAAFSGKNISVGDKVIFDESLINGILLAINLRKSGN